MIEKEAAWRTKKVEMMEKMVLQTVFGLLWLTCVASSSDWLQFRGNTGEGLAKSVDLPETWSESVNVVWKTQVPGKGWSSPVVRDDRIWLTTAIEAVPTPKERERLLRNVEPKKMKVRQVAARLVLQAIGVDLVTGERMQTIDLFDVENPNPIHSLNSYASPTPVIDGERLYCHFGTYGTACVDTSSGEILWTRRLPVEHKVGPGSSPIIHENLIVLVCDGVDIQYVEALDTMSGETVWKTDRPAMRTTIGDHKKAYSTPLVVRGADGPQLVIPTSQWVISYEPQTGEERWRVDHGDGFSIVPRPVHGHGMVYVCTGFGKPQLWAIRIDGRGDVTHSHVAWKARKQIPAKPSPILVGNELYVISDSGIATCFDAQSGKVHWTQRMPGNYSASPVSADEKIYFCSHEGVTTVIRPGIEYQELASNQIDGTLMASPVVLDRAILLRTDTSLYRIQ